jgi:hypothetical protein
MSLLININVAEAYSFPNNSTKLAFNNFFVQDWTKVFSSSLNL